MADITVPTYGENDERLKPVKENNNGLLKKALGGLDLGGFDPEAYGSLVQQQAEASGEVAKGEARQKSVAAKGKADAEQTFATGLREQYKAAEPTLMSAPPKFNVTKDTQEGLTGLAALMTVGSLIIGSKGSTAGVNAMNAMTGVLKGYQEGNQQRIDFETKKYEQSIKEWERTLQQTKESLSRYEKLATADLGAATSQAAAAAAAEGQTVIAAKIKQEGLSQTRAMVDKLIQQTATTSQRIQDSALVPVLGPDNKPMLVTRRQANEAAQAGTPYTPAPRSQSASGPGGVIQFRYNQAVANASYQAALLVKSAASLPLSAAPPAAADVLTNPAKSITDAEISYFAGKVTAAENRAVQQSLAGLNRAIAAIEASGRPGGVTEASIKEISKMAPRAGDKKINTYLFFALVRQEFDVAVKDLQAAGADPKQISLAELARDQAYEAIPYTVDDVTRIIRSGKPGLVNENTRQLLTTAQTLKDFESGVSKQLKPGPALSVPQTNRKSAEDRFNELEASGMPEDQIYKTLQGEGY